MKDILRTERIKTTIIALCLVVFGALFVSLPETAYRVLVIVLGCMLIALGLFWIIAYFMMPLNLLKTIQLGNGALFVLLGSLFLIIPSIYLALVGFGLAFVGLQYITFAIAGARAGAKGYWYDLVNGILQFLIGLALIVLRYTKTAQNAMMICLGISLIIYGLFILCSLFMLHKVYVKVTEE